MKFICTTENYRHFMGRLFIYKQPTEITDKATIAALERNPDFMKVEAKEPEKAVIPDECPKCGKVVKRGKVMHAKWCKGK